MNFWVVLIFSINTSLIYMSNSSVWEFPVLNIFTKTCGPTLLDNRKFYLDKMILCFDFSFSNLAFNHEQMLFPFIFGHDLFRSTLCFHSGFYWLSEVRYILQTGSLYLMSRFKFFPLCKFFIYLTLSPVQLVGAEHK